MALSFSMSSCLIFCFWGHSPGPLNCLLHSHCFLACFPALAHCFLLYSHSNSMEGWLTRRGSGTGPMVCSSYLELYSLLFQPDDAWVSINGLNHASRRPHRPIVWLASCIGSFKLVGGIQTMMKTVRQAFLAGILAGFLAALLFLVDYGPGNSLHGVARWLGLDSQGAGKFVGFLLMLVLGGVFGLLFGVLVGRWRPGLGRWLLTGLVIGAIWWVLVVLVIRTGINHLRLNFGDFLISSVPLLVYGLLLGSIAFQWREQNA